jgi:precorrin isomerase
LKIKSLVGTVLAVLALSAAMAVPATAAVKLPVATAADKAFVFAKRTCAHDRNCVRYGVTNCRRQSLHVVLCRIFDERSTEAQGTYQCTRLVRVALDPVTYRILVTGQAPWQC